MFLSQKSHGSEELTRVQLVTPQPKLSTASLGFIFGWCSPKTESYFLPRVAPKGWCFRQGPHFSLSHTIVRSGPFCCFWVDLDYPAHMKIRPKLSKQILIYSTSGHSWEERSEGVYWRGWITSEGINAGWNSTLLQGVCNLSTINRSIWKRWSHLGYKNPVSLSGSSFSSWV